MTQHWIFLKCLFSEGKNSFLREIEIQRDDGTLLDDLFRVRMSDLLSSNSDKTPIKLFVPFMLN